MTNTKLLKYHIEKALKLLDKEEKKPVKNGNGINEMLNKKHKRLTQKEREIKYL